MPKYTKTITSTTTRIKLNNLGDYIEVKPSTVEGKVLLRTADDVYALTPGEVTRLIAALTQSLAAAAVFAEGGAS